MFGQSAGGFNIVSLLGMEQASGLYHKAIPMSGSLGMSRSREAATKTTDALADTFDGIDRLRDVPAEAILKWQLENAAGYGAVLDGEVIREPVADVIKEGRYTRGMPLLIGTCETESALWTAMNPGLASMTGDEFRARVGQLPGVNVDAVIAAYSHGRTPLEAWTAIMTDQQFRLPAIRTADLHRTHTDAVWMYLFDHKSPAMDGKLGSVHSLDIPFVWGTLTAEGMDQFCGRGPAVEQLSTTLMDTWIAFATSGNPNHAGIPEWHKYDDQRATMRFGASVVIDDDPMSAERQALL
jgi:para-nitrobenzyl esterase